MKPFLCILLASWIPGLLPAVAQVREATVSESSGQLSERVYSFWTTFLHPRCGYELPVPPGVRAVGVPEAVARTKFVSPDGGFVMSAWGGVISQPAQSVLDGLWAQAKNKPGRAINYSYKARTWFVVSGTGGTGTEFYEKFTMRGNQVAGFSLTYPRTRLREFEPWVEKIENGFCTVNPRGGTLAAVPAHMFGTPDRAGESLTEPGVSRELAPQSAPAVASGTSRVLPLSEMKPPAVAAPPAPASLVAPAPATPRVARISRERLPAGLVLPSETDNPDFQPGNLEKTSVSEKPASVISKPVEKPSDVPDIPVGEKVAGRPEFVYSPFREEKSLVDVAGIAPGTKVKCPYTEKIFRVP